MNENQKAQLVIISTIGIIIGAIWGLNYIQEQKEITAWAFYGEIKYRSSDPPPNIDVGNPILISSFTTDLHVSPYPQLVATHITFTMEHKGFEFLMPDGNKELIWVKIK